MVRTQPFTPVSAGGSQSGTRSLPLLSHLRWIAALIVVLSHIEQDILSKGGFTPDPIPYKYGLITKSLIRSEGYGHLAVIVFFVLSGFLVGGKLVLLARSQTAERDWPGFLVDRFTRIFVVVVPVLLLTGVIFAGLVWLVPTAPFVHDGNWAPDLVPPVTADRAVAPWVATALMLNEIWTPTLITNNPLWSLAYEWCYYIMGLAVVLCYRRIFSTAAVLVIGWGVALVAMSLVNQPDVLFSGLSWVAGIGARLVFDRAALRSRVSQISGIAAVIAVLALGRAFSMPDFVLGAALALMIAHTGWTRWTWGAQLGDRLAGFSFSLYALHFPVLLAVMGALFAAGLLPHRLPFGAAGFTVAGATLLLLVGLARVFALMTEDQTVELRRLLMRKMKLRSHAANMPVVAHPAASAEGAALAQE